MRLLLPICVFLASCTTANELKRPDGKQEFLIACGATTPWSVCYSRANKLCPQGYETLNQLGGFNRKEMRILCPSGTTITHTKEHTAPTPMEASIGPSFQLRAVDEAGRSKCEFLKSITKGVGGSENPSVHTESAMNSALGEAVAVGADSYYVVDIETTNSGASVVIEALRCK